MEFDIPYRELKFTGVPAKSSVDIMPTVHRSQQHGADTRSRHTALAQQQVVLCSTPCSVSPSPPADCRVVVCCVVLAVLSLVALDDQPPLVLPLNEVEIAVFERVQFGLRNFDLVFVYKDFARLPMRIDSIPMKYLEPIKHWLNSCDLVYYESNQNLLWKAVMKHINSDVEDFWRQGGWSFLADQDDDAAEGEGGEGEEGEGGRAPQEESESEFELSSAEEEDDDSEEYDTASSEEEDDDEDSAADDSDEEGEDWDELENKAKRDDRNRREKAKEKGERDFSDEDEDEDAVRGQEVQGAKKKQKPAPRPPQPASRPKSAAVTGRR